MNEAHPFVFLWRIEFIRLLLVVSRTATVCFGSCCCSQNSHTRLWKWQVCKKEYMESDVWQWVTESLPGFLSITLGSWICSRLEKGDARFILSFWGACVLLAYTYSGCCFGRQGSWSMCLKNRCILIMGSWSGCEACFCIMQVLRWTKVS